MGYFDGLTAAAFKMDSLGRQVFYPWGVLGKGYLLPDEKAKDRIRNLMKTYYMVALVPLIVVTPISLFAIGRNILMYMAINVGFEIIPFAFYIIKIARMVKGFPVVHEKLRMAEAYANSAKSHNLSTLIFMLVFSVLLIPMGLWLIFLNELPLGFALFLISAACISAIGYMVEAKLNQRY